MLQGGLSVTTRFLPTLLVLVCLLSAAAAAQSAPQSQIQHVLLISVDGLHALDVANYISKNPQSALAELSSHGVTYRLRSVQIEKTDVLPALP